MISEHRQPSCYGSVVHNSLWDPLQSTFCLSLLQDCAIHPSRRLVAAGLVDGGIRVLDCSGAELRETTSFDKHKDSCRSLEFVQEGNILLSGSADKSFLTFDVEAGKVQRRTKNAHKSAIER